MSVSVVIVGSARTPVGAFQGNLASLSAPKLGAVAISSALSRSQLPAGAINEVFFGCVLSAGIGQAPARQATIAGGLGIATPATTINKMCGSGMMAVMLACDALQARPEKIMLAGGMESMSNAPYLAPKARAGLRLGHGVLQDHMFLDGLEDAYDKGRLMGSFAEDAVERYQFSRAELDAFASESLSRAQSATRAGRFRQEIAPVAIEAKVGATLIENDEQPLRADAAKIPLMRPAFRVDGAVTAANSSSISDGAAALVLCAREQARQIGAKPLARIVATARYAGEPALYTSAPVFAIRDVLAQTGWGADDVDLYEINEAFAVVALIAMRELGLRHDRVNVNGGACAIGHPIGASGARILVTLINALAQRELTRGIAAICIGGGEATAVALERLG